MAPRHLVSLVDWSTADIEGVLDLAHDVKANPQAYATALSGKTLAMIFQKSSTRTRVSFEVGMFQLGGHALFLSSRDIQIGRGEPISDTARVLSRYVDIIMARVYGQEDIDGLAKYATVPVINGLSDSFHPCQALTDYFTMQEVFGRDLRGRKLAYVGDGNNMAHSLLLCGAKLGVNVSIGAPKDYSPDPTIVAVARAANPQGIAVVHTPAEAISGAHVVYTDVWASMGQEAEQEKRVRDFAGYTITPELMSHADPSAVFMHCLPAHRGEEVSAEVCDGPQSVIYQEAENRLHVQKALMLRLLGKA
jgi:ornithine carbamoyltransferase